MCDRVKRKLKRLRALALMQPKHRKLILKAADKELIQLVCECAHNLLKGNVEVEDSKKKKLARYKAVLRRIVKKGECFKKKKNYIIQKGGGILLPLLISAVIQAVLG